MQHGTGVTTVARRLSAWLASRGDQGASVVEYAMLIGLIVMVCLAAMTAMGEATSASADNSAGSIATAN